jgi:RES domain-containing protein
MEVFRICRKEFSGMLTASGKANRWNKNGQFVIYTGCSRALSTLESVVNRSAIPLKSAYKVMVISIPDDDRLFRQIRTEELPDGWRTMAAIPSLQNIGKKWYDCNETLILKVPSAVIPFEYNYIINTKHPLFKQNIQLIRTEDYFWDNRLF